MEAAIADVSTESQGATESTVAESSTVVETSGESQGSVNATEEAQGTQETPADVLEGLPTLEELKAQAEQKVPMAQGLYNVRAELERVRPMLKEYEALDTWKPIAETIGDPQLAQSAYSLISAIHTPFEGNPSGYTTKPFIEQIDTESPGTANQLFVELASYVYEDENGQRTTPTREMYKAHGLNPDRIDDYRNIDSLRASGVVTQEDLTAIPDKYHPAFRALSTAQREDIVAQRQTDASGKVSYPLATLDYLQDKAEALEAREWREQDAKAKADVKVAEDKAFEQHIATTVETKTLEKVKSWSNAIHQSLSSHRLATDDTQNNLEYMKILSTIATLQSPAYRFIAEDALKAVGASLEGFDELINQWQAAYSAQIVFSEKKDQWQAKREEAKASLAEQRITIKLNDYARRLAESNGDRLKTQSEQVASQLAAASGRFVPNGNGTTQQGFQNPYSQNPHSVGTEEYYAFNRKVDREYKVTGASMFGGN